MRSDAACFINARFDRADRFQLSRLLLQSITNRCIGIFHYRYEKNVEILRLLNEKNIYILQLESSFDLQV